MTEPIRILLIEDDSGDAVLMEEYLRQEEFEPPEIVRVKRLSEARAALRTSDYDLVLLDLTLPAGDPESTLDELLTFLRDKPYLIVTGNDCFQSAAESVHRGAQDYLVKGEFDARTLRRSVMHAIERHKLQSALNQKLRELARSEQRFRVLSEKNSDGIVIVDNEKRIKFINPAGQRLFGDSTSSLLGRELGPPLISGDGEEFVIHREKGRDCLVEARSADLEWEGMPASMFTLRDVTMREELAQQLYRSRRNEHFLISHDPVTGLPNRQIFFDRLQCAMAQARRHGSKIALLKLDLDRFRRINETYGHERGDQLLRETGCRLASCIRSTDSVSRLGGDEFAILLSDVAVESDAEEVCRKVHDAMLQPFSISGQTLSASVCIGVCIYPDDTSQLATLQSYADSALVHAQDAGDAMACFFNVIGTESERNRLELERTLRHAIKNDELRLHYQPQVNILDGKIVGVEALLRWQHPEFGLLTPGRFISIAEETSLIVPIGEWVLEHACQQGASWHRQGFEGLRIAVNLSARQFRVPGLVDSVQQSLKKSGIVSDSLALEITESSALQNTDFALATLNQLKSLGPTICVDDFGTGFSSLHYLRQFPFDVVKIDRSFVRGLHDLHQDWAIISGIISVAQKLGLRVLAEGVENTQQLAYLRSLHCDEYQGYLCSRPVTPEAMTKLLRSAADQAGPDVDEEKRLSVKVVDFNGFIRKVCETVKTER